MNKFEMVLKKSAEENKRKEKERSDWEANNWREFIADIQLFEKQERKKKSK